MHFRDHRSSIPWRQLVTVISAIAVIVTMVVVAETAQRSEARHQAIQVLVERVRATSEETGELTWQGLAQTSYGDREHLINERAFVSRGLMIWGELSTAVDALRRLDQSPMTIALVRDADHLYGAGIQLLPVLNNDRNVQLGMREAQTVFTPTLTALDKDSLTDASVQERVANAAAARSRLAYIGSLVIGLALLVLLGFQLYRIRRRSLLIEERRSVERRTEQRVRALVEHSSDIITVVGPDLTIRWQSSSVQRRLGVSAEALHGSRLTNLVHPDDAQLVTRHLAAAAGKPGTVTFTARFREHDGGWRHMDVIAENHLADPAIEGVVLSMRDISERIALEDELRRQAFHDSLTGLANRALFEDRLEHALADARRRERSVAVLFLDLDDFKTINDSIGHVSGDLLLRAAAGRIAATVRAGDTAARLGGDEFAVLLGAIDGSDDPHWIARRLLEEMRPPFEIGDRELSISASIGVALSHSSMGVEELLRNADTAMYAAKEAGKGTMETFQEDMHTRVLERLELTTELQHALKHDEFELDYQPIVELDSGRVVGCEALVRWAHNRRGRLAPAQFIPLAEQSSLIVPLGAWILERACAEAASWQQQPTERQLYVSVNVSTRQLHDPMFASTVAGALHASGLEPELLILEITESLLPDDNQIIGALRDLKALGVGVAVDDFGTGYSALSRLQAYPVDILKIDRAFIDGIENDPGKAQLVRGIVNLGENLSLRVVAEGIETSEQADQLRSMRSLLAQGYLFSGPVTPDRLHEMLETGKPLLAEHLLRGSGG